MALHLGANAVPATADATVQYMSGSTGDPKGVVLTHGNLLANIRALGAALKASQGRQLAVALARHGPDRLLGGQPLGCIENRPRVTVSLAADHRVTDGDIGGLYLAAVARLFQEVDKL